MNQHDCPLFKAAFETLMKQLTQLEIPIPSNPIVNLDPGFDSNENKKTCLRKGCTPNIKTNPRNSKTESVAPQPIIYKQRYVNERAFAWEDRYRRLVIRYEVKARNYYAFCLMAAALTLLRLVRVP